MFDPQVAWHPARHEARSGTRTRATAAEAALTCMRNLLVSSQPIPHVNDGGWAPSVGADEP